MKKILKAFSHINFERKRASLESDWEQYTTNDEIISSDPILMDSYDDLIDAVAQISFYNIDYFVYFRGQSREYLENNKTTIYSKFHRKGEFARNYETLFEELTLYEDKLIKQIKDDEKPTAGSSNFTDFREFRWAIIQHYNRHPTPCLDITHSLHVACSFALREKKIDETGIIYLMGYSNYPKTISYSTDEKISITRLMGFGMPIARRPYLQQAFSICPFPFDDIINRKYRERYNFSRRLLAKFEIKNTTSFWDNKFQIIPDEYLLPNTDILDSNLLPPEIDMEAFWYLVSQDKDVDIKKP